MNRRLFEGSGMKFKMSKERSTITAITMTQIKAITEYPIVIWMDYFCDEQSWLLSRLIGFSLAAGIHQTAASN